MGTQSSLWRPGACSMLALAVFSLLVCANGSRLPASSEQVMPKLHLAYLVEDVEYPRPEGVQASKEVCMQYTNLAFTPERPRTPQQAPATFLGLKQLVGGF